ncbi:hypothetical protein [Xanthomonas arboricola]|uniref:hypothetical protein n=1 Tax=Xanthomonas arboricola TaxID=56448 RepID=UPI0011B0D0DE|nr:hypothetical protein [Xanthomonas arboricola]
MRQQILDLRNENLRATGSSEENKVGYGQHIKVPNSHLTSGAIVSGKVYLRTGLIDLRAALKTPDPWHHSSTAIQGKSR